MAIQKPETMTNEVGKSLVPVRSILFPTDFSEVAHNAFEYTLHLAEELGAHIVLLHVYQEAAVDPRFVPADLLASLKEEKMEKAMKFFHEYQREAQLQCNKEVEVRPILESGHPADVVVRLSRELDIDLICMGTLGAESHAEKILGSITSRVIEDAACSVMAIPAHANFTPIRHIMYATNFEESDFDNLDYLLELADVLGARISCTHIQTDGADYWDKIELSFFEKLYQEEIERDRLAFFISKSADVIQGLQHFINTHNVDLLAMLTHRRDILSRIYGSDSMTREMAMYTDVPLLAFHTKQ